MKRPGCVWLCVTFILLELTSTSVAASDWLVVNPLKIDFLLRFDASQHDTNGFSTDYLNLEGGVYIKQDGYILHPGIVEFTYFILPSYSLGKYTTPTETDDLDRNNWSYGLVTQFLHGTTLPVSGSISASRKSFTNVSSLGNNYDSDVDNFLVRFAWNFKPFPIEFWYESNSLFQNNVYGSTGRVYIRDEDEETWAIRGKSTKMQVDFEHVTLDDKVPERNNDFIYYQANLRHNFSWGKGSTLATWFNYYDRTGFNAYKRTELRETARISHTESLTSQAEYSYRSLIQNQDTTQNRLDFGLYHRLYRNLQTFGKLIGSDIRSDDYVEQRQGFGLGASYNKSDFMGVGIGASVSGELIRHDLDSRAGLRDVVDEPHRVPLTGEIILGSRYIVTGTIVVADATGTWEYVEGIDYQVVPAPSNLTRLYIIPGGQIPTGDLILVSYRAAILPSVKYDQLGTFISFSINFRGLGFSYSDTSTDNKVISGEGGDFLSDSSNKGIQLFYSWDTARTSVQLSAERRLFIDGLFEQTNRTFVQSFSFRISPRTLMDLNLTESYVESGAEEVDNYIFNLTLHWQPNSNWSIRPSIGAWRRTIENTRETQSNPDEDLLTASLHVRWAFRLLSLDFSYNHNDRTLGDVNYVDDRVFLNLRRKFR